MDTAAKKQFTPGRWATATFLGWLLGVFLILVLSSCLDAVGIEHMQFYIGVGMGVGVGLAQWRFLKKHLAIGQSWIWTSLFGMGLPFLLLDLLLPDLFSDKLPLSVALGGTLAGLLQLGLLKEHFPKASRWVIACFLGWTLAALAVLTTNYTLAIRAGGSVNLLLAILNLLIILSGGLILGFTTGIAFKKMR